ncbi:MAG: hypothetical protein AAGF56_13595, partial [Pseudomonadota bacterium]
MPAFMVEKLKKSFGMPLFLASGVVADKARFTARRAQHAMSGPVLLRYLKHPLYFRNETGFQIGGVPGDVPDIGFH